MELSIYKDCIQLLQHFDNAARDANHAEFELFCQSWHSLRFAHIYSAQTTQVEVIQTTLAALHVAKRIACGRRTNGVHFNASRSMRIGGYYLMYAIYHKQPTLHFVKIDVCLETWKTLNEYVDELLQNGSERRDTQQVADLMWKLKKTEAFRFTALDYCRGLEGFVDYDHLEEKDKNKKHDTQNEAHRPLLAEANFVEELTQLHELNALSEPICKLEAEYNKQKKEIAARNNEKPLPPTTVFTQLKEVLNDFNRLLNLDDEVETVDGPTTSKKARKKELTGKRKIIAHYSTEGPIPEKLHKAIDKDIAKSRIERRMSCFTVFEQALPEALEEEITGEIEID